MHSTSFVLFLCFLVCNNSLRLLTDASSDPYGLSSCKTVYLDIGSNLGVQVRKLFEPELYKDAQILPVFDEHFGDSNIRSKPSAESGVCAIGFEANPTWTDRLKGLEKVYKRHGWNAQFMVPRVVADVDDENVTFFVDNTPAHNNWGSSVNPVQASESSRSDQQSDTSFAVTVQTLDLSNFIQSTVLSSRKMKVVAKMDIEGSEYIVIPEMVKKGLMCVGKIDVMFMEWHENIPAAYVQNTKESLLKQIESAEHCNGAAATIMLDIDDESYLYDGMPFPNFAESLQFNMPPSLTEAKITQIFKRTKDVYAASQKIYATRRAKGTQD